MPLTSDISAPSHDFLHFFNPLTQPAHRASVHAVAQRLVARSVSCRFSAIRNQRVTIEAIPAGTRLVRAWDFAGTDDDGDWTAGALLGQMPDGRYVVADMVRFRAGPEQVEATLRATAQRDTNRVPVAIPQDPGQAGKMQAKTFTRALAGFSVSSKPVSGDKVTRARPLAAQVNVGNVVLLRGEWNAALIQEMRNFPNGLNDDQVDALSLAFDYFNDNSLGLLDYYRRQADEAAKMRALVGAT